MMPDKIYLEKSLSNPDRFHPPILRTAWHRVESVASSEIMATFGVDLKN